MKVPAPRTRRARRVVRALVAAALASSAIVALLIVSGWQWLLHDDRGAALLARIAVAVAPQPVTIEGVRGTLSDHLQIATLTVDIDGTRVRITELDARIEELGLLSRTIVLSSLSAREVQVLLPARSSAPQAAPTAAAGPAVIALPLALTARDLRVSEFSVQRNDRPLFAMNDIDAALTMSRAGVDLKRYVARIGSLQLTMAGTLDGRRPFAIDAGGVLTTRVDLGAETTPVQATFHALDSLTQMTLNAGVTGGPEDRARGSMQLQIAAFADSPLQALHADVAEVELADWGRRAPHALLRVQADLNPTAGPEFALVGLVHASNGTPGPWNEQRIPIRELSARLLVDAQELRLTDARATLVRGMAMGAFTLEFPPHSGWKVDARVAQVDPASIDTRAQTMRIDGVIQVASGAAETQAKVDLRAISPALPQASLALQGHLTIDSERARIDNAHLQLGAGRAEVAGELSLRDEQPFTLSASVRDLNPGIVVKGFPARFNGTLQANGALRPQTRGTVHAQISESTFFGRPLRGRVDLTLETDGRLNADVDLALRSAQLTAHGGLGAPDQHLTVALSAPALGELVPPLQGALTVEATLTGSWLAPQLDANATINNLAFQQQRIRLVVAKVNAQFATTQGATSSAGADRAATEQNAAGAAAVAETGDAARASDTGDAREILKSSGPRIGLDVEVTLLDHRHPRGDDLSIAHATATIKGELESHALVLRGDTVAKTPFALAAHGGWSYADQAWSGSVEDVHVGAPLALALTQPAPMHFAADRFALGPATFTVFGASVREAEAQWRDAVGTTRGQFDGLVVQTTDLVAGEEPLTLRGNWDIRAGDDISAQIALARSGGDIHSGVSGRRSAMGLTELHAEASLRTGQLQASAILRGTQAGNCEASLTAEIARDEHGGWQLAAQRPWHGALDAQVPSLAWINPFLSQNLRDDIRVGGSASAQLRLAGTPAVPQITGPLQADSLRLAWVEQGVRLDNGSLRAHFALDEHGGNEVVFDDVHFSAQPRARPQDRRIARAISSDNVGTLTASGRVKLPELDGVVQVQLVKLPILQRPDRWLVATGGANIVASPKRIQLNGAAVADAGFIDFSHGDAPTLSSDINVVRSSEDGNDPVSARSAGRVAFDFDVAIDLGPAFLLRGSGLDTRAEGALRLKHEGGGQIRATGTIEAKDGTFEGYGQKLAIERGRVNFQGPIENPGLDILALRKGLPVEVGVTVTRTAANPLIRLYSDPPLADFETLSWLVLGRAAEQSGSDNLALARAAIGLLGGTGEGISSQLARRLGIDDISLRGGDLSSTTSMLPRESVAGRVRGTNTNAVGGEIVSIGKRLNDAVTLSYEQSVNGAGNVVQLSYQLSRRLSLIARAGTENALDLVYTFAFD